MDTNIEWRVSGELVPYPEALAEMQARAAAIRTGEARELVWLLEHPPLYTAGTSADPAELFNPAGYPVFAAGRGGRYTYHGPGQRVGYVLLNLANRGRDVRAYVHALEGWVIAALAGIGIASHRAAGRIGIWTDAPGGGANGGEANGGGANAGEAKIGAIGVRVSGWVTMHGFAINVDPDLGAFSGIVPCGISEFGVTSVRALGHAERLSAVDESLENCFEGFLDALSKPQVFT